MKTSKDSDKKLKASNRKRMLGGFIGYDGIWIMDYDNFMMVFQTDHVTLYLAALDSTENIYDTWIYRST